MTDSVLSFPDLPRTQLDKTLNDLVEQAREVLTTQGRLRALLRASQALVESLDLDDLLQRVIEAAIELAYAQYGALGVVSPSGGLERFIHSGMSAEQVDAVGHLPEGLGLLGALIDDPRPIRLAQLSSDPRSQGFPPHHPPMDSFLGVPLRTRGRVFGNLYLTNQKNGEFTAEDEQLVGYLAAMAGFAIENARLFDETRRRQAWAAASGEVTSAMLSTDQEGSLEILLSRVCALADADLVHLAARAPNGESFTITLAQGVGADELVGQPIPVADTVVGRVFEGRQPLLIDDTTHSAFALPDGQRLGPVMGLPLMSGDTVEQALVVARVQGRRPFEASDLDMAAAFAAQGAVAVELIKARTAQQRMALLEDRSRIARDLHDHVIQQLFGTGLELQSMVGVIADPAVSARLTTTVGNIDSAINQIRTAIFALSSSSSRQETIRHRILDLASELGAALASTPSVAFAGPVDLVISGALEDDVTAVVREAVTNVIKHSGASHCTIRVEASASELTVTVGDNGHGMSDSARRSGVANLQARAVGYGGSCSIESSAAGTTVIWTVPLAESEPS